LNEAIRYPGFAFVNVQSPCITYGDAEHATKNQRMRMRKLEAEWHEIQTFRQWNFGQELRPGRFVRWALFYRNPPGPPPTRARIPETCKTCAAKPWPWSSFCPKKHRDDEYSPRAEPNIHWRSRARGRHSGEREPDMFCDSRVQLPRGTGPVQSNASIQAGYWHAACRAIELSINGSASRFG